MLIRNKDKNASLSGKEKAIYLQAMTISYIFSFDFQMINFPSLLNNSIRSFLS